jgi:RNA polymerase sigma-70 factor (ECF subfamily)
MAAQAGEVAGLGTLLVRHRAGMTAVALSVLGYGPDAEDAVQDASLLALRRIGELRDPSAVGPWLRAITRNCCLARLRATRPLPVAEHAGLTSDDPAPHEVLDRIATRDWVWHAVGELSEPLRLVTVLRYFTRVSSYEQIAAVCGVPVGTVRSRLSHARGRLATALRETADDAHDDTGAREAAQLREAREVLAAAERGRFADVVRDTWAPDAEFVPRDGLRAGGALAVAGMTMDLEAGVRQRVFQVAASRDLAIWEAELISPPDRPDHCPPGVIWVLTRRGGLVQRLRLFHPRPEPERTLPGQ